MIESKLMEALRVVLSSTDEFKQKYWRGEALKRNKVVEDLRDYDANLIEALLKNELIANSYTMEVAGNTIVKLGKLSDALQYKEYWEDSYTKFANKIGLSADGKFIDESSDVVLQFPFADTVLKSGMSKEKSEREKDALRPDEPFLNETIAKNEIDTLLSPKIFKNVGRVSGGTFDRKTGSLIVKGNNLITLHSLKKVLTESVKFVYLDVPYNTGSDDFDYNDNFNHSSWLTFMKNRLEIAKDLMSTDSVIAIQTDYHENAYLKVLMDSIFGPDNFVADIAVKMSAASGPKMAHIAHGIPKLKDDVLVYKKGTLTIEKQPYVAKAGWDKEYSKVLLNFTNDDFENIKSFKELGDIEAINEIFKDVELDTLAKAFPAERKDDNWLHDNAWRIVADKQNTGLDSLLASIPVDQRNLDLDVAAVLSKQGNVNLYRTDKNFGADSRVEIVFAADNLGEHGGDFWTDISTAGGLANEGGVQLPNAKKPEKLIGRLVEMFTKKDDLVLDFFMGSGTTQAVAMKLERRFVGAEQITSQWGKSLERLKSVATGTDPRGITTQTGWQGGGSFVYAELMEKNQGYIGDIAKAATSAELDAVYERMKDVADFDFRADLDKFIEQKSELTFEERKQILVKILDKNQLYYNYADIDDVDVRDLLSDEDYNFNKAFYEGGEA
ncbi:site-specific DNA-methyltransferase [Weissella confusa]|uniref:site-specific DNA-methyltransferase n=1 Tax=Weissella confusa TaxID=1583 RepID=UPI00223ADAF8|nr:site-specific DNA-methyltransferase [Weissella confusa]MCT0013951.1 site-specific DNA-methyltransferase [Weissella confusa]